MWTGRETLGSIESAIAEIHREESQLDAALRSAVGESDRLRKERGEALRELARVKLDEMAAGRLVENLDAGERRAAQLLDEYRGRIASIAERREALLREVAKAQAERDGAAKLVETALDAVEAVRADAEAKVKPLPAWQQAKAASDAADAVATEAEKKAALSEADLGAKKKPYDDDPLFIYLWRRGFGTGRYDAGNFTRYMDRMVADFIGFGDVRANYAALTEIPLRLREHANAKRAAASEKLAALSEVERRAMLDAGIEPKERALAEARAKLAAADKAVEDRQGALRKVDEERGTLVSGGANPAYEEALATIALADSKDQLAALYQEARRTPTSADDAIVRQLESIDSAVAKADAEIAGLRRTAQELAHRRLEVEEVRDRFRGAGYDHPHATFGNGDAIAETLKQVLAGAAGGILWDILRGGYSNRGPRGRPDFGYPSSPFPFPIPGGGSSGPSGGDWREPDSRGDWSAGESAGGGDDGDDDRFTTGGSY
jgi:regulator of replication initiation timing